MWKVCSSCFSKLQTGEKVRLQKRGAMDSYELSTTMEKSVVRPKLGSDKFARWQRNIKVNIRIKFLIPHDTRNMTDFFVAYGGPRAS